MLQVHSGQIAQLRIRLQREILPSASSMALLCEQVEWPNNRLQSWRGPSDQQARLSQNAQMAERTGLEPATPGVTGRYSNRGYHRNDPDSSDPKYGQKYGLETHYGYHKQVNAKANISNRGPERS